MLSKYTILHDKTKLEQKKEKMQKSEMDADPPWGDGERARRGLVEDIPFLLLWVTIINKINCTLVLVIWDPKAYNKLVTS